MCQRFFYVTPGVLRPCFIATYLFLALFACANVWPLFRRASVLCGIIVGNIRHVLVAFDVEVTSTHARLTGTPETNKTRQGCLTMYARGAVQSPSVYPNDGKRLFDFPTGGLAR